MSKLAEVKELQPLFERYRSLTLIPLLKEITNLNVDVESTISKIEQVWHGRKTISLPFWGNKSEGGVLYHSVPFWIGKAFLKTNKPIIGLSENRWGSFSGCLSQDYYEFAGIVTQLSKLLRMAFSFE